MFSVFFKNSRLLMSVIMVCVVITMLFFGTGGKNIPQGIEEKKVVYQLGSKDVVRSVTKKQIEAMKTYLNFDLGYGLNDVLERQNIFSDGFFIELISSDFGKKITSLHYDLLKDDFDQRMKVHKRQRLYKHWSGKLNLEDRLEMHATSFYDSIKKVQEKGRAVDISLLHDMIDLSNLQMEFTPDNMKSMMRVLIRDNKLGVDSMLKRRNFALFQAKSNEDFFGSSFIELFAQVILEGAAYARDHNFYVSYEEAEGVIMRHALDLIEHKFTAIEEPEERFQLLTRFEKGLGLSRRDLVKSAQAVMMFQKMLRNVDNSLFLDKMSLAKLFSFHVDTLLVKKVTSNKNLKIRNIQDALELNSYLASLGDLKHPLIPPLEVFEEGQILERAPHLFTEAYVLKLAACSKKRIAADLSLQKVWSFQTSDEGWKTISDKFSFGSMKSKDDRFDFLQQLEKEKKRAVDLYSRNEIVQYRIDLIKKNLSRQELKKDTFHFNDQVRSKIFPESFDENRFIADISALKEGDALDCYTQDNELYFRVVLIEKPNKKTLLSFEEAKSGGCLAKMVDDALAVFTKSDNLSGDFRDKMLIKLLTNRSSNELVKGVLKSEGEKKVFFAHQKQILDDHKKNQLKSSTNKHLKQFNLSIVPQKIARSGEERRYAVEEFFALREGEKSCYKFDDSLMYYVQLKKRNLDERKLRLLSKKIHSEMSKEAKASLYHQLISHIEENDMLELSRFKEGA
jgi:hypothetical protein